MSRIVSSASTTRAHSRQRSSQPSFVQTSLAVAMFSALTAISLSANALTLDHDNKTVTVDEAHTIQAVQEQNVTQARLFSNTVLVENAATQAEASGYHLIVNAPLTCPEGTSFCSIGAARLDYTGLAQTNTSNSTLTLSSTSELRSATGVGKIALYAGSIEFIGQTDATTLASSLISENNRMNLDGLTSLNVGDIVAGRIAVRDTGTAGAQSGTLEAHLTNNKLSLKGVTLKLSGDDIVGADASIIAKNAVNVSITSENNSVLLDHFNDDTSGFSVQPSLSGIDGTSLTASTGTGEISFTALNNSVVIKSGQVGPLSRGISGAYLSNNPRLMEVTSENNSVTVEGGTFTRAFNVYGTYVPQGINRTVVTGNQVTIKGGDFVNTPSISFNGSYVGKSAATNSTPIESSNNQVVVSGGQGASVTFFGTRVYGEKAPHILTNNIAKLEGGTWNKVGEVTGAYSHNAGADVTVSQNKAEITGGTVTDSVKLLRGVSLYLAGNAATVVAQKNEVLLTGAVPVKEIEGAFATGFNISQVNVSLINNKVTLSGTPDLENAEVYGGRVNGFRLPASMDVFTGNTLVVDNYTGTGKLNTLANFEKYEFVLPATHEVNESVALTTATLALDSPTDSEKHARIESVSFLGEPRVLKAGDHVNLINADTITGTLANKDQRLVVDQGVTVSTLTLVRQEENQIYLEVQKAPTNGGLGGSRPTTPTTQPATEDTSTPAETPDTGVTSETPNTEVASNEPVSQVKPVAKTFSEGYLAGALASVSAGDLVAGQAMTEAKLVKERFARWKGFGVASGIRGKYNTGSHIDTKDTSLVAGLLRGVQFDTANLTLGVFFEAGRSRYDTHNDVSEGGHGRGTVDYTGGGALVRLDAHNGLYAEASVRAGNARNEFDSSLVDALGRTSSYKVHSNYFGFHVGAGYEWQLNDKLGGEVYAKYLFTRLDGDDVTTTTGDLLSFDSVTSQRLRVGGRVAYQMSERLTPYVGLGVEREFSAKSKATAFELPISAPSLTGTSGMAEVGLKLLEPKGQYGWSADVNLRGYFGTRQEIGGNVRIGYKF